MGEEEISSQGWCLLAVVHKTRGIPKENSSQKLGDTPRPVGEEWLAIVPWEADSRMEVSMQEPHDGEFLKPPFMNWKGKIDRRSTGQRGALDSDTATVKGLADSMRTTEARMTLQSCHELGQGAGRDFICLCLSLGLVPWEGKLSF